MYCIYTLYLNTLLNMYLITVFNYFCGVYKYMHLNTFINTFLHTSIKEGLLYKWNLFLMQVIKLILLLAEY